MGWSRWSGLNRRPAVYETVERQTSKLILVRFYGISMRNYRTAYTKQSQRNVMIQ
jgi:hypothetical protein